MTGLKREAARLIAAGQLAGMLDEAGRDDLALRWQACLARAESIRQDVQSRLDREDADLSQELRAELEYAVSFLAKLLAMSMQSR